MTVVSIDGLLMSSLLFVEGIIDIQGYASATTSISGQDAAH